MIKKLTRLYVSLIMICIGLFIQPLSISFGKNNALSGSYGISSDAKVTVESGELQGMVLSSGVRAFLGVPYANPPVGNLRWKAPQKVTPWTGTKEVKTLPVAAAAYSATYTPAGTDTILARSEDALYLNMWIPPAAEARAGNLPVMVWMHGMSGNASEVRYNGEQLARKGLIVVLPQRRQGVFGTLALGELSVEKENKGTSGHFDFLDMTMALQWVHDNISKFGGNPDNVTLGGQSYGSIFSLRLQASTIAKGLLKRVFAESGSLLNGTYADTGTTLAAAEEAGAVWMSKFGTVAGTTEAASLADLRAKSMDEIVLVDAPVWTGGMDYILPDSVTNIFLAGKQSDVPLYLGWCRDESGFAAFKGVNDLASYRVKLSAKFGTDADTVFNLYPAWNDADAVTQALRMNNDYEFGKNMVSWARLQMTKGKSPVYMYIFYRGNSTGTGAIHGRDVNYWFGNLNAAYSDNTYPYTTPADYALSNKMMDSLIAYCTTGNPNTSDMTVPRYNQSSQNVVGLDVNAISIIPIYKGVDWFIDNADKYYTDLQGAPK